MVVAMAWTMLAMLLILFAMVSLYLFVRQKNGKLLDGVNMQVMVGSKSECSRKA